MAAIKSSTSCAFSFAKAMYLSSPVSAPLAAVRVSFVSASSASGGEGTASSAFVKASPFDPWASSVSPLSVSAARVPNGAAARNIAIAKISASSLHDSFDLIISSSEKLKSAQPKLRTEKCIAPIAATQITRIPKRRYAEKSMHFYQKEKCTLLLEIFY